MAFQKSNIKWALVSLGGVIAALLIGLYFFIYFTRPVVQTVFPDDPELRKRILGQVKSVRKGSEGEGLSSFVLIPVHSQDFGYSSQDRIVRINQDTVIEQFVGLEEIGDRKRQAVFEKVDTTKLEKGVLVQVTAEGDIRYSQEFYANKIEILPAY